MDIEPNFQPNDINPQRCDTILAENTPQTALEVCVKVISNNRQSHSSGHEENLALNEGNEDSAPREPNSRENSARTHTDGAIH